MPQRTPFLLLLSLASVPLETMAKLAEVCKRHKVWLHIDGTRSFYMTGLCVWWCVTTAQLYRFKAPNLRPVL